MTGAIAYVVLLVAVSIWTVLRFRAANARIMKKLDWVQNAEQISGRESTKLKAEAADAKGAETSELFAEQKASLFTRVVEKNFYLLKYEDRVEPKVGLAGIGTCILVGGGLLYVGTSVVTALGSALVAAPVGAWIFLTLLKGRSENRFLEDLPVAVDQVAQLTRSGLMATQAMTIAGEQQREPLKGVLRDLSRRLAAGVFVEDAIEQVAGRVKLSQFSMVCVVILLQREAGGSIAKPLLNIVESLRARGRVLRKIKAATGQARLTLMIVTAMPVVVVLAQSQTSPDTADFLLSTPQGQQLLVIGVGLILTGLFLAMFLMRNVE